MISIRASNCSHVRPIFRVILFQSPTVNWCEDVFGYIPCCHHYVEQFSKHSWWRHQMKTFSALLTICAGNSPSSVNSPHKGQRCRALLFSLICAWINSWVNNREAGDLRRHRAHYDVTVMLLTMLIGVRDFAKKGVHLVTTTGALLLT